MRAASLLLLLASTFAPACSSPSSAAGSGGSSAAGAGGGATGVCASDGRAQVYTPGMEAAGAMGLFRVRLVSIDPAPAVKGDNAWVVEIVDACGATVSGATVAAKPYMPDHGHGSSIVPTVTELGAGRYQVASLVLFMPGLWQTTIAITAPGAADSVVFSFCVAG